MTKYRQIKFGIEGPNFPWERISSLALFAEKLGFDSYWMPDHLVATGVRRWDALDAWGTLCSLAVITKKIKLGVGVSDTYRYHPAVLAQKATTCDIISGGRVIMGIGIGEAMNLVPFGIPYDKPIARTAEALEVIRKLWSEEIVNFEGKYFRLNRAILQPKPSVPIGETRYRPALPIFIAASSPMTMKLVAKYGDGWLPANLPVDAYSEGLKEIRAMAEKFGRDPRKIEPALFVYSVIANSYDEARSKMMLPAKMMLLSRPKILERMNFTPPTYDFEMTFNLVFPDKAESWMEEAKKLPDELVDRSPYVFGSPDDIIGKLERYVEAGCRHFIMNFQVPARELEDSCKLFADKVISYFRGKH